MKNQLILLLSITILFVCAKTPIKKKEYMTYVSNDAYIISSKIKQFTCKGWQFESLIPQSVAYGVSKYRADKEIVVKGDLVLLMSK